MTSNCSFSLRILIAARSSTGSAVPVMSSLSPGRSSSPFAKASSFSNSVLSTVALPGVGAGPTGAVGRSHRYPHACRCDDADDPLSGAGDVCAAHGWHPRLMRGGHEVGETGGSRCQRSRRIGSCGQGFCHGGLCGGVLCQGCG